jgi:hypothetical protein
MNINRAGHGFAHYGVNLYAFGGATWGSILTDTIEIYDMITNTWIMSTEKIIRGASCVAVKVNQEKWVLTHFGHVQVWSPTLTVGLMIH